VLALIRLATTLPAAVGTLGLIGGGRGTPEKHKAGAHMLHGSAADTTPVTSGHIFWEGISRDHIRRLRLFLDTFGAALESESGGHGRVFDRCRRGSDDATSSEVTFQDEAKKNEAPKIDNTT